MKKLDFEGSTLLMTPRSPFARRVRLAFREAGLEYAEKHVEVLKPSEEILDRNPLARVPAVVLKSGQVLVESSAILESFYEWKPSTLFPIDPSVRSEIRYWSALGAGMAEKTVEFYFEKLRPEESRDEGLFDEITGIIGRVLAQLESRLALSDMVMPSGLTQADLDCGTALRYLCVRRSSDWRTRYKRCSKYLERLETRPSFQGTKPPDA